jgi:hypothetical protein
VQNRIDPSLVAASRALEPFHNVMVKPDSQTVFGSPQGEFGMFPERSIQPGDIGVVDVRIPHLAQALEASLAFGPRP